MAMTLEEQQDRATKMLRGKMLQTVFRHRSTEIGMEFTDGTRLFVDVIEGQLEISITGDSEDHCSRG